MAYCGVEDLLIGDIPLASKYGDGFSFIEMTADEIDAQLGSIYVTPIEFSDPLPPADRPAALLLKKINQLLASARIILDMAAGGEDDNLHSYGMSMRKEALDLLGQVSRREIVLTGAAELETEADNDNTGPTLVQDDPYSLVQGFYERYSTNNPPLVQSPMRPYDQEV